ncbi:efflux RND transporter periplasmic adaptor subunit [Halothiobacillus sp. DCM-1]|uniref:efflux RND transporter periplasmic adaptor subunit n=1 Tax=Halothiobacillus sp. DCM-1 TaxID=3112558 RepID=UPI003245ED4F
MNQSFTPPHRSSRARQPATGLWLCLLGWAMATSSFATEPTATVVSIPAAMRPHLAVTTEPLQAVEAIPLASGLATIAAGSSADSRVIVSAPVEGSLNQPLPPVGQAVSKGTALIRLDSPQLAALQANAQMTAARLRQAEQTLARDRQLLADGLIAQKRWQATEAEANAARAAHQAAQTELKLATGEPGNPSAPAQLTLTAPADGVIVQHLVQPGSRVSQGTPLLALNTAGQWWLLALPVAQLPSPREGVTLRIPGCPAAPLRSIDATVAADSQLVTLRAEPAEPCAALRPGQRLTATLWTPVTQPTYAIPVRALSTRGDTAQVFVARGEDFLAIEIRIQANGDGVAFASGDFKPGDQLVVAGANRLKAIQLGMGAE